MNANRRLCMLVMLAVALVLSACKAQIKPGEFQRADDKSERLVLFPDGKLLHCFLIEDSLIGIAKAGSYHLDGRMLSLKAFLPSSFQAEQVEGGVYTVVAGNNRFLVPYGQIVEDDLVLFTRVGDISPEDAERLNRVEL